MTTIINADGHIVEPRALWHEYIEPALTAFGEDVLMWASDYPHFDCTFPGLVVEELQDAYVELPEDAQDKIMGENAARC